MTLSIADRQTERAFGSDPYYVRQNSQDYDRIEHRKPPTFPGPSTMKYPTGWWGQGHVDSPVPSVPAQAMQPVPSTLPIVAQPAPAPAPTPAPLPAWRQPWAPVWVTPQAGGHFNFSMTAPQPAPLFQPQAGQSALGLLQSATAGW